MGSHDRHEVVTRMRQLAAIVADLPTGEVADRLKAEIEALRQALATLGLLD